MEKPVAIFYPRLMDNMKYMMGLCLIGGIILSAAIFLKYGFTMKDLIGIAIFESVMIPFLGLIAIAGTYNFKVKIYENGISSPYQFLNIPFKWEFIRWDEIEDIKAVKVLFAPYFMIITNDNRFHYLPKKMQKHLKFIETINQYKMFCPKLKVFEQT